jgi:hypothetical protein
MPTTHPCRELPALTLAGTPRQPPPLAVRSYQECGEILGISWQAVRQGEQRAFRQLAAHPLMKRMFQELGQ